jgi:hypothetical protein
MSRRRGGDTPARKRRRLPFVVVIEREEPSLDADQREIDAACLRITNGAEYYHGMSRFDLKYLHVFHFGSRQQADTFRRIAWDGDYVRRPVLHRPTPQEREAHRQTVMLWGFRTGAIRRVLRAWRNTRGSLHQQNVAGQLMVASYRVPEGDRDVLHIFLEWAGEHHWHWLHGRSHPGWLPFDELHWVIPQDAYPHSDDHWPNGKVGKPRLHDVKRFVEGDCDD